MFYPNNVSTDPPKLTGHYREESTPQIYAACIERAERHLLCTAGVQRPVAANELIIQNREKQKYNLHVDTYVNMFFLVSREMARQTLPCDNNRTCSQWKAVRKQETGWDLLDRPSVSSHFYFVQLWTQIINLNYFWINIWTSAVDFTYLQLLIWYRNYNNNKLIPWIVVVWDELDICSFDTLKSSQKMIRISSHMSSELPRLLHCDSSLFAWMQSAWRWSVHNDGCSWLKMHEPSFSAVTNWWWVRQSARSASVGMTAEQ